MECAVFLAEAKLSYLSKNAVCPILKFALLAWKNICEFLSPNGPARADQTTCPVMNNLMDRDDIVVMVHPVDLYMFQVMKKTKSGPAVPGAESGTLPFKTKRHAVP